MMKRKANKLKSNLFFVFGIIGMAAAIFGVTFLPLASLLQREVFLVAVIILLIVAEASKQKILDAIEIVLFIGIVLALFSVSQYVTLTAIAISVVILVAYLLKIHYYNKEPIGVIGTVGFVLLAIGYGVNTGNAILLNSFAFSFGAIAVAIYSLMAFILYKVRVQIIWFILNVAFAIGPLIYLLTVLL